MALFALASAACSRDAAEAHDGTPKRPLYRPGESITNARLCACEECWKRSCCSGDPGTEETESAEGELGMSVAACGRCARRVWTVRTREPCAASAPEVCCPGSIAG